MRFAMCTVVVSSLVLLTACESTQRHEAAAGPTEAARAAEVACAQCVYHMASASHCQPAVKIGGQTYLLSGVEVDLHQYGLCKGAHAARVAGRVEGDTFVAGKVDIEP